MAPEQQSTRPANDADRLERSARLWLRAYPRRWRAAFGDDLVGVLLEVGPPGTRRVTAREAAAIVRAGWALRLREHPSLLRWLGYRFLDIHLPLPFQHWVVDDILGRFYLARMNAPFFVLMAGWSWYWSVSRDWNEALPFLWMYLVVTVVTSLSFMTPVWQSRRREAWQRHVSPEVPRSLLSARDKARTPLRGSPTPPA